MRRFISYGLAVTTVAAGGAMLSALAATIFPGTAYRIAAASAIVFGLGGLLLLIAIFPYWREQIASEWMAGEFRMDEIELTAEGRTTL